MPDLEKEILNKSEVTTFVWQADDGTWSWNAPEAGLVGSGHKSLDEAQTEAGLQFGPQHVAAFIQFHV